jgi:hypothetical protein
MEGEISPYHTEATLLLSVKLLTDMSHAGCSANPQQTFVLPGHESLFVRHSRNC